MLFYYLLADIMAYTTAVIDARLAVNPTHVCAIDAPSLSFLGFLCGIKISAPGYILG
jgi:hypothetical protein